MDLLTLAILCGPLVAPATVASIVDVESGRHTFAIHDNTSHRSFFPQSLVAAEQLASRLIRAGHRLDLGLMQVNYDVWFAPAQVRLEQAFNPCLNVAFGTTILSAAYTRESSRARSSKEALKRASSIYNSGDAFRARDYADLVIARGRDSVLKERPNASRNSSQK